MANKQNQNALRSLLMKDGTVRASTAPSEFRHVDMKASMNAAIEARRMELKKNSKQEIK